MHTSPSIWQPNPPHFMALRPTLEQVLAQQSELVAQVRPSLTQAAPQPPITHDGEQQSAAVVQGEPSGRQASPHTPVAQFEVQQSPFVVQLDPMGLHTAVHVPLPHSPEQHWSLAVHAVPPCRQLPTHAPLLHTFEQHALASWQAAPSPLQGAAPQAWFAQAPLQHSEKAWQAAPSGLHWLVAPLELVAVAPPADEVVTVEPVAPSGEVAHEELTTAMTTKSTATVASAGWEFMTQ